MVLVGISAIGEKKRGERTVQGKSAHGVSLGKSKTQAFDIVVDLLHAFEGQLLEAQLPGKRPFWGTIIQ